MPQVKTKRNIRELDLPQLQAEMTTLGLHAFRAKQVYEWLWKKAAGTFDEMTNLSLETREKLSELFEIRKVKIAKQQVSNDRTVKFALELHDGHKVEGVLIPTSKRMTACISSQVGCSLACKFCATGKMKLMRNLTAGEIYDQVVLINEQAEKLYKMPLSNIVYMGMGEPLLNYKNVLRSTELITSEKGLNMSPKRITISTAGIAKMIKKLGDDEVKFNLALSLHAANEEKRSKIMPINDSNSLTALVDALNYFYSKTQNRLTFEYIIFKDFNDDIEDARELTTICKKVPARVNIIEYNPIDGEEFEKAEAEKVDRFQNFLETRGIICSVRRSRGKDIDAACGQLAGKLG